jgi:hypothetical protein
MDGTPYFIDGSRTLKASSDYPTINQRRARSHIEQELGYRLEFVRHLRTNRKNRQMAARVCTAYMLAQMKLDAFTSQVPEDCFTVDVGDGMNSPAEEAAGRLNIAISMKLVGAYDWVVVYISKKTI